MKKKKVPPDKVADQKFTMCIITNSTTGKCFASFIGIPRIRVQSTESNVITIVYSIWSRTPKVLRNEFRANGHTLGWFVHNQKNYFLTGETVRKLSVAFEIMKSFLWKVTLWYFIHEKNKNNQWSTYKMKIQWKRPVC